MKQLHVLFDTTWGSDRGGTGRYVRSLRGALDGDLTVEVISVSAPRLSGGPRWLRMLVNGPTHLLWTQLWIPANAWVKRVDVVHTTMTAPIWCRCPNVLTLHDALDFIPAFRPSRIWSSYMRSVGAIAARQATIVLTGSDASAAEIARYYGVAPDRLRITRYGSTLTESASATDHRDTSSLAPTGRNSYVLMVGSADRRKDLDTGLQAIEQLRREGVAIDAVIVGTTPPRFAGLTWVRTCSAVADDRLAWLYENALAVVVPSRHEGYGLPVVEALAFGTPVVASDIPALREVGGSACRYAPTGDAGQLAKHLAEICEDPAEARRRVAIAAEFARTQTWDATKQATVAVYRDITKG